MRVTRSRVTVLRWHDECALTRSAAHKGFWSSPLHTDGVHQMSALGGRAGVNPLARREAVDHVARRDADASAAAARAAEASARDTAEAKTQDVALLEKLAAHLTETGFLEDVEVS